MRCPMLYVADAALRIAYPLPATAGWVSPAPAARNASQYLQSRTLLLYVRQRRCRGLLGLGIRRAVTQPAGLAIVAARQPDDV